jgi:hypothetical protein
VRGARAQSAPHQGKGEGFRFQRLGSMTGQTVPQQRHQDLGARVDAEV